jgi:hypothetical protein
MYGYHRADVRPALDLLDPPPPEVELDDELELLPLLLPPPPEIPQGLSPFAVPVHEHQRVPELESGKSPHPSIEYDEPEQRTSAAAPMS